jgi:hypothetical protein
MLGDLILMAGKNQIGIPVDRMPPSRLGLLMVLTIQPW